MLCGGDIAVPGYSYLSTTDFHDLSGVMVFRNVATLNPVPNLETMITSNPIG